MEFSTTPIKLSSNYIHINTEFGRFFISASNSKVAVPIVSAGTAENCPNIDICPFSHINYKATGYPLCYAYKAERLYPSVRNARLNNEQILKTIYEKYGNDGLKVFGDYAAIHLTTLCRLKGMKYVRINESSDLSDWNFAFFVELTYALKKNKITTYGYTKSGKLMAEELESFGAKIMTSESDFIVVKSVQEANDRNLKVCPGIGCGTSCLRCPKKLITAALS